MEPFKTALERAFDLARSGECKTIDAIKRRLKAESYNQDQIDGRSLCLQLRALMASTKKAC